MAYEAALAEAAPNASSGTVATSDTGKKMPATAEAAATLKVLYEPYPSISE